MADCCDLSHFTLLISIMATSYCQVCSSITLHWRKNNVFLILQFACYIVCVESSELLLVALSCYTLVDMKATILFSSQIDTNHYN